MSSYKIWAAQVVRRIDVFANFYENPVNETTTNFALYYSLGAGADELLITADNIDTSCQGIVTFYVPPGNTLYLGFTSVGKSRTPYYFDGDFVTDGDINCPNTINNEFCGTNNVGLNPLAVNISSSNVTIALTIKVVKGSFVAC